MKSHLRDLAIFGGPPLLDVPVVLGRPNIGDRERLLERFKDLLDRRWLTNDGPYVREFEERIRNYVGTRHCVVMSNATVALELAVRATSLTGEVIVPAFTFVATPHVLQWQGIVPVFCDIEADRPTIDPERIEALITPRTTGILAVHLWSQPCAADALAAIARRHNLRLIYDAAHAFGCTYKGRPIGQFGDAEVFSFHATKFCNSFEGGALVTDDDAIAAKVKLMRNFGFSGLDQTACVGINAKMPEVSAAMGLTSLESIDDIIAVNRGHYLTCLETLAGAPGLHVMRHEESERSNYQYLVLEVDREQMGLDRDGVHALLATENILARRYFSPGCHKVEPYRTLYPAVGDRLPNTERLADRVLALPTGTGVTSDSMSAICALLRFVAVNGREIRAHLEQQRATPHQQTAN